MEHLEIRFRKLWNDLALAGELTEYWRWLKSKYEDKDRHYHTLEHIAYGLDAIDQIVEPLEDMEGTREIDAVRFAFYYHDSMPNEIRSADAVSMVLFVGRKPDYVRFVSNLVLHTDHRKPPGYLWGNVIVDADLAVFASDKETFDKYEDGVRKEYARYSDSDYAKGRIDILSGFLKRDSIYQTIYCKREWESKARENLMESIKKLGKLVA